MEGAHSTVLGADLLHFTLSHFVFFCTPDSVIRELGKANDTARYSVLEGGSSVDLETFTTWLLSALCLEVSQEENNHALLAPC